MAAAEVFQGQILGDALEHMVKAGPKYRSISPNLSFFGF
jgi:hypothetical protein